MLTMNAPSSGGTSIQPCELPPGAASGAPHLQAAAARLGEQQGEHPGVAVRTHALRAGRAGRITDHLDQRGGCFGEGRVEHVGWAAQRGRPVPEQGAGHHGQRGIPLVDDAGQLGHRGRPLVGALQPQVVGLAGPADRGTFRSDVDLLAPIHLAAGSARRPAGCSRGNADCAPSRRRLCRPAAARTTAAPPRAPCVRVRRARHGPSGRRNPPRERPRADPPVVGPRRPASPPRARR